MNVQQIARSLKPWGLHDAFLEGIKADLQLGILELRLRIMVTKSQDMDRVGVLTVSGLVYLTLEPAPVSEMNLKDGVQIDSIAPSFPSGRPDPAPAGTFTHAFYLQKWRGVLQFCGREASFEWIEDGPKPARSENRALFPGDTIPEPETAEP